MSSCTPAVASVALQQAKGKLKAMASAQMPGFLHVVANLEKVDVDIFKYFVHKNKWRPPEHDGMAAVEGEDAQKATLLMLEVLKTCLMRRNAAYARHLVKVLTTAAWVVEPGGCSYLAHCACRSRSTTLSDQHFVIVAASTRVVL
jgi:hypothetical protein